jgi:hypothetical protein
LTLEGSELKENPTGVKQVANVHLLNTRSGHTQQVSSNSCLRATWNTAFMTAKLGGSFAKVLLEGLVMTAKLGGGFAKVLLENLVYSEDGILSNELLDPFVILTKNQLSSPMKTEILSKIRPSDYLSRSKIDQ